jgi:hypothetical protein
MSRPVRSLGVPVAGMRGPDERGGPRGHRQAHSALDGGLQGDAALRAAPIAQPLRFCGRDVRVEHRSGLLLPD